MSQLRTAPLATLTVAKGKKSDNKQINFSAPPKLASELEDIAAAFNMDVANLVRMMLSQNMPTYRRKADRLRQGLPAEEPEPTSGQ